MQTTSRRAAWWTPERRVAFGERMRALWASGQYTRRQGVRPDVWSAAEDAALRELAGTLPLPELTAALNAQSGMRRSPEAVKIRATRRGVSLWCKCLGMRDLERIFGVDHRAIGRNWLATGLLPARRWPGRGPNAGWWIEPADVERFIRACGWAYDWQRMPPGRWRALAEVAHRADPWRSYADLAAYVGLNRHNLDRWRRRGLVPCKRRPKSGGAGYVMVRGKEFAAIKAAITAAQTEARARARRRATDRMGFGARGPDGKILPGAWRVA